jgi:hypothetical protein
LIFIASVSSSFLRDNTVNTPADISSVDIFISYYISVM